MRTALGTGAAFVGALLLLVYCAADLLAAERDLDLPLSTIVTALQPDLFTGALTAGLPIEVPPGRQGIQPNLNLAYWSSSGNGWIGMGWKLELGAIERQTRFGVDYSGEDYTFRMDGVSTDLVTIGGGEYRAKIEGGFTRVRKLTAGDGRPYWEATDKRGIRYLFGQTAASRMADPASADRIFKWCLDRVEDPNGNYMTLTYWGDQGQGYLSQIDYTGHGSTAPTNTVRFYLESRPDAPAMYTSHYLIKTAYRLKTIEVLANGVRVRAYKLTYTTSTATARSLLARVELFGKDATLDGSGTVTGGTSLPAVSLGWQSGELSFVNALFDRAGIGANDGTNVFPGDFNGDGETDIAAIHQDGSPGYSWVAFSNGDGTFGKVLFDRSGIGANDYTKVFPGDFNGDGKTDIAAIHQDGSPGYSWVAFSNGNGTFNKVLFDRTGINANSYTRVFAGDFNGDGKADIAAIHHNDTSGWSWVAFSNGGGTFNKVLFDRSGIGANDYTKVFPGDFNGDGKSDIAAVHQDGSPGYSWVAFSNGDGTFTKVPFDRSGINANDYTKVFPGDFNGDGKADIAAIHHNDASGWSWVATSAGLFPDVLATIINGLGGTATITYVPSTQYSNTQLPFPIQTVSAITTDDGNGNVSTTSYTYAGGFHHIGERDFRGFNYEKVTGPVGPNGEQAITETWFHQGNDTEVDVNEPNVPHGYLKGKPYRVRVADGQERLFTETTTSYAPDPDDVAPFFTPPDQVDTTICDGTGCGKQTRVVYAYDDYGNVTREDQYGDLADSADDRMIIRSFTPNPSAWIVGLPASETIYEGLGFSTQMARTDFYYDGVTSCTEAATSQTPTRGQVTRIVRWLSGGTSPETRAAYDAAGNRLCARDANGHTTTYTYDSTATFLTVETNALGHQRNIQYYGVDGVPADLGLHGQIKRVTDPNGAVVAMEYDVLGRRVKVTQPDGFWTTTSYVSLGTVGQQHVRTDNALGLASWTNFDGVWRPFFTRSTGPDSKVIATQTQYDARGAVRRTSLPYFDGLEAPNWRTQTYDPLGRVLQRPTRTGVARSPAMTTGSR